MFIYCRSFRNSPLNVKDLVTRNVTPYSVVKGVCILGGLDLKGQEAALRKLPDVIIATPGRLLDHLHNTPSFTLNDLEILILDEADR